MVQKHFWQIYRFRSWFRTSVNAETYIVVFVQQWWFINISTEFLKMQNTITVAMKVSKIYVALHKKQRGAELFIVWFKAFDVVWQSQGFWSHNSRKRRWLLFHSILLGSTGVPQGSVLGPPSSSLSSLFIWLVWFNMCQMVVVFMLMTLLYVVVQQPSLESRRLLHWHIFLRQYVVCTRTLLSCRKEQGSTHLVVVTSLCTLTSASTEIAGKKWVGGILQP